MGPPKALTLLTRRTEDSLLTLDTLQKRMETVEHLMPGFERTLAEMRRIPEATEVLKRDVTDLQQAMRECVANQEHSFRRLDAMQSIFEENNKLRSDVAMMKRATEINHAHAPLPNRRTITSEKPSGEFRLRSGHFFGLVVALVQWDFVGDSGC